MSNASPKQPHASSDTLAALDIERLVRLAQRVTAAQTESSGPPLEPARAAAARGIWSGPRQGALIRPPFSIT
jgi:hypothetical protein